MPDILPPSPSSIIQRKVAIAACFGTFLEWYDFLTSTPPAHFSTLFFSRENTAAVGPFAGPQTAMLAERLQARKLYTAVSLPQNLSAGWMVGLSPFMIMLLTVLAGTLTIRSRLMAQSHRSLMFIIPAFLCVS
jgi:hypothetical protein